MRRKKIARNESSNIDSIHSNFACLSSEWYLPYSLVLRNIGILSSLLLSKTCENFDSGFEIFPCAHRSSFSILFGTHQRDGALVPVPLFPGWEVRDVDRRDVVQVSAIFFCPSMD